MRGRDRLGAGRGEAGEAGLNLGRLEAAGVAALQHRCQWLSLLSNRLLTTSLPCPLPSHCSQDAPPPGSRRQEPRFSFVSGGYTGGNLTSLSDSEDEEGGSGEGSTATADHSMALALHAQQALQITAAPAGRSDLVEARSAADYLLHKRSWQGVETPLTGAAPAPVVAAAEGRAGRAAGYAQEGPGQRVMPEEQQ